MHQLHDFALKSPNTTTKNELKVGIPEFLDSGRKSWTLDSGRWTLEAGRWTLDTGLWTLDPGCWTVDSGL